MKNLYALNIQRKLIHINEVDKAVSGKYHCLQCGDELIARKGKIKRHHFAHKNKIECNFETYLHKLGKLMFYDAYKDCIVNKKPFYIQYEKEKICNSCTNVEPINRSCNLGIEKVKFDL